MAYKHKDSQHDLDQPSIVVPHILEIIRPKSVLDIGCGYGNWLKVFKNSGAKEVLGVDGDYVEKEKRRRFISDEEFFPYDLTKELNLGRKFDLAISLEVAEHIPASSADAFVKSLVNHSDTIVFSAAIPNQGGQNHFNEQPLGYWIKKFQSHGYHFYDPIRSAIWDEKDLFAWYKQNMILFSKTELKLPPKVGPIEMVHPDTLKSKQKFQDAYQELVTGKAGLSKSFKVFIKSLLNIFR